MGAIQVYQYFVADTNNRTITGGSLSQARTITLTDDEVIDREFKIATETAVKVWDKTVDAALGGFDFLWISADLDVSIQFTTDAGTSDGYDVKTLKGSGTAGEMGPALILGSNVTKLIGGTIDLFDGTADTIDEIWVYNADGTETARIRVVIAI